MIWLNNCITGKRRGLNFSSKPFRLTLSKKYGWSKRVDEAVCYYLGKLGIKANQFKDVPKGPKAPNGMYRWRAGKSPFLLWMVRSCLGLQSHECTTNDAIKTDWILTAPEEIRIKFLQGLNDGDGFAIVKVQRMGNACGQNIPFVKKLLKTFNIESGKDGISILIRRQKSISRQQSFPSSYMQQHDK